MPWSLSPRKPPHFPPRHSDLSLPVAAPSGIFRRLCSGRRFWISSHLPYSSSYSDSPSSRAFSSGPSSSLPSGVAQCRRPAWRTPSAGGETQTRVPVPPQRLCSGHARRRCGVTRGTAQAQRREGCRDRKWGPACSPGSDRRGVPGRRPYLTAGARSRSRPALGWASCRTRCAGARLPASCCASTRRSGEGGARAAGKGAPLRQRVPVSSGITRGLRPGAQLSRPASRVPGLWVQVPESARRHTSSTPSAEVEAAGRGATAR